MKNFETLEVGKSYKNRIGEIVTITGLYDHEVYKFESVRHVYMPDGRFYLEDKDDRDLIELIELIIEDPKTEKRPHADLIVQWANDKNLKIQVKWKNDDEWVDTPDPNWDPELDYRIKPEPVLVDMFLFAYQISDESWVVSKKHIGEKEAIEHFHMMGIKKFQKIEDSKITVEI